MKKAKILITGIMLGVFLSVGVVSYAAENYIKFVIDGVDQTPANGIYNNNGTKIPAYIIENGTTYIPLRMVSDMLSKPIEWDGSTRTIYVGEESVSKRTYLSTLPIKNIEMSKYQHNNTVGIKDTVTLDGQTYTNVPFLNTYYDDILATYALNDKYDQFSTLMGIAGREDSVVKVEIFGDGKTLWEGTMTKNMELQKINIDVSGVMELKIKATELNGLWDKRVYFANAMLTKSK